MNWTGLGKIDIRWKRRSHGVFALLGFDRSKNLMDFFLDFSLGTGYITIEAGRNSVSGLSKFSFLSSPDPNVI